MQILTLLTKFSVSFSIFTFEEHLFLAKLTITMRIQLSLKGARMKISNLFFMVFIFSFLSLPAFTATITVTSTADSGVGSLRQAVADASSGDVINFNVSGDTITLTSGQIVVPASLTIQGPGEDALIVESNGNPNRVFEFSSGTTSSVSGLTIRNGDTDGVDNGGCILNEATLSITEVTIEDCSAAANYGGAIYSTGSLSLTDTSIDGNTADFGGAVMLNTGATLTMSGSTLSQNVATSQGGALYNNSNTVSITDTLFILNQADDGGSIFSIGGTLTFTDSTISMSTATGFGGGFYGVNSTVTLDNVAMAGNQSDTGGAIFMQGFPTATLTMSGATISNNTSDNISSSLGGGIYFDGASATATLSNVTIASNSASGAGYGGGLIVSQGTATLNNVTIAENHADLEGGGLVLSNGGSAMIQNSIIANNTADSAGPDCSGILTSQDYNLIEDTSGCTVNGTTTHNVTGEDPQLGTLQNNGGYLNTMALATTSPALNAANPETPGSGTACATVDERGVTRPQEAICDMGAFELAPGLLALSASTYSAAQDAGTVTITVQRSSDSDTFDESVSVNYATSDGTAVAGTNYTSTSGTLTWAAGDSTAQTVSVPILNAASVSDLTFNFTLSDPTSGASLISPSSAVITLTGTGDDDSVLGGDGCSLSPYNSSPLPILSLISLFISLMILIRSKIRA